VLPQLTKLKGIALELLFPSWCVGCGRGGSFICDSCLNSLTRIKPPLCPICGLPQTTEVLCNRCADRQMVIDGIRAPFAFDGVMRQAIHQLKYQNLRAIAGQLGRLLHEFLAANPLPGEVLVPVPLHQKRLRERGYNQSRLLAEELGKLTGLAVADYLSRERHSLPQARSSSADERQANVAGAFSCASRGLENKAVILIDDVSTSGATLNACAYALKEGGASSVWGLVLAREI
jgi:ComF family protein